MNGCEYIKERIDEADRADLLSFEVNEHIGRCSDCERFATERMALRKLVAGGTRISAPINFDAVLNARLAEVKARHSFRWLGTPGYVRLGAATAGLVVMIFVAQYAGMFSDNTGGTAESGARISHPLAPPEKADATPPREGVKPLQKEQQPVLVSTATPSNLKPKRSDLALGKVIPPGSFTAEDGGVVLVRGPNGDMDVQVPTVSVGAQPLLYVSAGQRTVRTVGTSF